MSDARRVKICAHRGASGQAPENTLAALQLARDQGAAMIEVDVQRTVEGELVLFHDETLERTTNGRGRLTDLSLPELQALDAGSWFGPEFQGQRIPTLTEALARVGKDFPLNLELKGRPEDLELAGGMVDFLSAIEVAPGTIVTSFARELIDHLKERLPDLSTGQILSRQGLLDRDLAFPHEILSVQHNRIDEAFMTRARAAGKRVHAWTVDQQEEVLRLARLGVEVVITNHPARVIAWLA